MKPQIHLSFPNSEAF